MIDTREQVLETAGLLLTKALPELWAIWESGAEGPRLHAEGRLALMDAGAGYEAATRVGKALAGWRESKRSFDHVARLNDALVTEVFTFPEPVGGRLAILVLRAQLDKLLRSLRGEDDLHHRRIHALSRKMREMADREGIEIHALIDFVAEKAQVPGPIVNRIRAAGEKVITQHVERVEKALRELEQP